MGLLPQPSSPPRRISHALRSGVGDFPVAEITALIDGRIGVPVQGCRDMPVWGERFGEIVGHDGLGEAVVHSHLHVLIAYLQAIQQ